MFSDDVELASRAHWPKNGPVPAHPVNGYGIYLQLMPAPGMLRRGGEDAFGTLLRKP